VPALAVDRVPRTLVFWTVWMASGASLFLIFYIPAAAQMFRVQPPPAVQGLVAILLGALAVVWRFWRRTG
jgi:hypothetical protein